MNIAVFEEPTLTRDILSYFAERIDTGAPITLHEFEQAFRRTSYAELRYHIGTAQHRLQILVGGIVLVGIRRQQPAPVPLSANELREDFG